MREKLFHQLKTLQQLIEADGPPSDIQKAVSLLEETLAGHLIPAGEPDLLSELTSCQEKELAALEKKAEHPKTLSSTQEQLVIFAEKIRSFWKNEGFHFATDIKAVHGRIHVKFGFHLPKDGKEGFERTKDGKHLKGCDHNLALVQQVILKRFPHARIGEVTLMTYKTSSVLRYMNVSINPVDI